MVLLFVAVLLFVPLIPAHLTIGSMKPRPRMGLGSGPCDENMIASLFYLLTGIGPRVVLNLVTCL